MSLVAEVNAFTQVLADAGFEGEVITESSARVTYSTDNSIYQLEPSVVLIPSTTADVARIVSANNSLVDPFGLVARGGGTGTNGQSLTTDVVVDFRRGMNQVLRVDVEARRAVVQPGVVLGELNAQLEQYGLKFAPHTATQSRATIGGMVATDAAGKGSLVHGRTNKHIVGLEMVLFDGSVTRLSRPVSGEPSHVGLPASVVAAVKETIARANLSDLPKLERGFSGYNLADAAEQSGTEENGSIGEIDFTKLICGAEGTLGLVTEIEVALVPLDEKVQTVIASYGTFAEAIEASVELRKSEPLVIEALDETTVSLAAGSVAMKQLAPTLNISDKALLICEFAESANVPAGMQILDEEQAKAAWRLRADAVGFLGKPQTGGAAVPFVEDCAVSPEKLPEFVKGFARILNKHHLRYGMFGHADVGCVHVRPVLDLTRGDDASLIRTVSAEVAQLVGSFGGVLWGEHGRGFRGEFKGVTDSLHDSMTEIKTAFDPSNVFNPRKLYSPKTVDQEIFRIDSVPLRAESNSLVHTDDFDSALGCNGNGICHSWSEVDPMCPSYKVTLDPKLSPKGRSDLLRAWLTNPTDGVLADEVADSMHQCLSCTACTTHCPVSVDIGELKSRFFHEYDGLGPRQKLRNFFLSPFESLAANRLTAAVTNLFRLPAAWTLGLEDLPKLKRVSPYVASLERVDQNTTSIQADVVMLTEVFSFYLDPGVAEAAASHLSKQGFKVATTKFVASGKFDHVKGKRNQFARSVAKQRKLIETLAKLGRPVVCLEPSITSLYENEYPKFDPEFPTGVVVGLDQYLRSSLNQPRHIGETQDLDVVGKVLNQVQDDGLVVQDDVAVDLFKHCTQTSSVESGYANLFSAPGGDVVEHSLTCCGMAGLFGHEKENSEMSRKLFVDYWKPRVDVAEGELAAAGYSCRTQIRRFGYTVRHPIELLNE